MSKSKLNIQDLIAQLKKIDVGELLEKAQGIKLDDIKALKLSDLKNFQNSSAFYPTLGIFLASLFTIFFLIPSYKNLNIRQKRSAMYNSESKQLPNLLDNFENRNTLQFDIEDKISDYKNLLSSKLNLIHFTEVLNASAKRTSVEILEFSPIAKDELGSCSSSSDDDMFSSGFDNPDDFEEYNDDFDDQYPTDDWPLEDHFNEIKSIEIYEFNYSKNKIDQIFQKKPQSLGDKFNSNYYLTLVSGDYMDIIKFNNALQEYKIHIIPYCFEPRIVSQQFSMNSSQSPTVSAGEVEARLILNIPTLKQ